MAYKHYPLHKPLKDPRKANRFNGTPMKKYFSVEDYSIREINSTQGI